MPNEFVSRWDTEAHIFDNLEKLVSQPARPPTDTPVKGKRYEGLDGRNVTHDPKLTAWEGIRCPIYVMGCNRRPGLLLPFLQDQSHSLHIGTDYDLSATTHRMAPEYEQSSPWLGNYRVWRGHQDMMVKFLQTNEPVGLFFEDDAVPNCLGWQEHVNEAIFYMPRDAEILSLYGRSFDPRRYETIHTFEGNPKRDVLRLKSGLPVDKRNRVGGKHHVFGSLAYLVSRVGAQKIVNLEWKGIPCDVEFWDETNFSFIHPSVFNHNREQGSLLFPESCTPIIP